MLPWCIRPAVRAGVVDRPKKSRKIRSSAHFPIRINLGLHSGMAPRVGKYRGGMLGRGRGRGTSVEQVWR